MKKILRTAALFLTFGCVSLTMTSCDSSISDILGSIIEQLFDQGETYNYSGTVTKAVAMVHITDAEKQQSTDETTFSNMTASIKKSTSTTSTTQTAQLSFGDLNWNSIQITGITLYGLTVTSSGDNAQLSIGDDSSIDGSFVFDGTTYTACYAEITSCAFTSSKLTAEVLIQFKETDGTDYQQVSFTYTGDVVTTTE